MHFTSSSWVTPRYSHNPHALPHTALAEGKIPHPISSAGSIPAYGQMLIRAGKAPTVLVEKNSAVPNPSMLQHILHFPSPFDQVPVPDAHILFCSASPLLVWQELLLIARIVNVLQRNAHWSHHINKSTYWLCLAPLMSCLRLVQLCPLRQWTLASDWKQKQKSCESNRKARSCL